MNKTLDEKVEQEFYQRFNSWEADNILGRCEVPPEIALRYDKDLDAFSVAHLFFRGAMPEEVSHYLNMARGVNPDIRIRWGALLWFIEAQLSREQVHRFVKRKLDSNIFEISILNGDVPREVFFDYHSSFSGSDIVRLYESGIPPSFANPGVYGSYESLSARVEDIIKWFGKNSFKNQIHGYYPEFKTIAHSLMERGVTPEQAGEYIGDYPNRFSYGEKMRLLEGGILPTIANEFPDNFKAEDITFFLRANVAAEKAAAYRGSFSGSEIISFIENGIPPEQAAIYDRRFSGLDILLMVKANVDPWLANAYPKAIAGRNVAELVKIGVSAEQAAAYPQNVQKAGIADVIKAGISAERALLYAPVFTGYHIEIFEKNNFQPETANKWAEYARSKKPFINLVDAIMKFEMHGLPPNAAMRYDDRITTKNKIMLWEKGIMPEEAMYPSRFGLYSLGSYYDDPFDEVNGFIERGIGPNIAAKFDQIFSGVDIIRFLDDGLSAEQANAYLPCKNPFLVKQFIDGGVLPEHASFIPGISSRLALVGVTSAELPKEEQHKKILLLDEMSFFRLDPGSSFTYIGHGTQAILLLSEHNTAFRFSEDIQREYALLQRVNQYHGGRQKNVLHVLSEPQRGIAVEVEYIGGHSLEQILYGKQRSLPYSEVLDYGAGILNGIRELREAGIFHRDINPWNVMISKDGKPIVIDLGVATANPDELYPGNRAFGGNNDLISLGLLMYRMATGNALFNDEHPERTRDNEAKDAIKAAREGAYDNGRAGLHPYLDKVRQDVKDPKLSGMIVTLLDDDLWKQPTLQRVYDMQKVFNAA